MITVIDVSAYAEGTTVLRAYMRRSVDTVSDPSATVSVTIDHSVSNMTTPTIEWEWSATEIVGAYASAFESTDPTPAGLSRWQIADDDTFADCASQSGALGAAMEWEQDGSPKPLRFGFNGEQSTSGGWDTDYLLNDDQDYYMRMQWEDALGNVSEWSPAVRVLTSINKSMDLGGVYLIAEDETANDEHGAYVFSTSNAGSPGAVSAQIFNHHFPYHRISGGATEYGVLCDNQEFVVRRGRYSARPFADVGGRRARIGRLRVRGYLMYEAVVNGHGLAGFMATRKRRRHRLSHVYQRAGQSGDADWSSIPVYLFSRIWTPG